MAITDDDLAFLLMQRLAAAPAIKSLIANRIKPDTIDENEKLPAVTYEVINSTPWLLLNAPPIEGQTRVQFDCYGLTRGEAAAVAEAIRKNLHGYSGTLGNITIHDCVMQNRYDQLDPPPPGGKVWRKRRTLDFLVSHTEPVPTL